MVTLVGTTSPGKSPKSLNTEYYVGLLSPDLLVYITEKPSGSCVGKSPYPSIGPILLCSFKKKKRKLGTLFMTMNYQSSGVEGGGDHHKLHCAFSLPLAWWAFDLRA
uniref:Uncharacterized protein n=1 Tax=Micrurus carvalhoi TaxID=3147026 RepID=A0A2H6NDH8_9SAUR